MILAGAIQGSGRSSIAKQFAVKVHSPSVWYTERALAATEGHWYILEHPLVARVQGYGVNWDPRVRRCEVPPS